MKGEIVTIKACPNGCEIAIPIRQFCYMCGAHVVEKKVEGCCGLAWKNWSSVVRFCPSCGSPRPNSEDVT